MFGVADADAMGGRPGLAAASPIDTPQPAPARAGQARSPWPAPSTALHAIAFEYYYNYYVQRPVCTGWRFYPFLNAASNHRN